MAHLKSRDRHPPGGFRFLQPQTGWRAPEWQSFSTVVSALISHRNGNPFLITQHGLSTDPEAVANEVDGFNAQICKANNWTEFYEDDDSPKPFPHRPYTPPNAVGVVDHARKAAVGIAVVREWLGDGLKPVDKSLAESRASICINCPHNTDPGWLQKLTGEAAKSVLGLIEAKNKMELITTHDAKLNTCDRCDCYLRLKVWTPADIVQKNTSADVRKILPPFCWILTEAKTQNENNGPIPQS